jgi:hypothetical protein
MPFDKLSPEILKAGILSKNPKPLKKSGFGEGGGMPGFQIPNPKSKRANGRNGANDKRWQICSEWIEAEEVVFISRRGSSGLLQGLAQGNRDWSG